MAELAACCGWSPDSPDPGLLLFKPKELPSGCYYDVTVLGSLHCCAVVMQNGTYGWNIESTQQFIGNEGEYVKMPRPLGAEEETTSESENTNPYIKGYSCCFCCCPDDQPEINGPNENNSEKGHYWCPGPQIPGDAVKAGVDKDGGDIYVGRAIHEGNIQPAKVVPNHDCAYIAYEGEEVRKDEFEVLCRGQAMVIWQECENGAVPPNAVPVGCTSDNERLFVGRVFHEGTQTPGKIQPSLGACYIPYGGEELCFPTYEVLILQ